MRITVTIKSAGKKAAIERAEYDLSPVPADLGGLLDAVVAKEVEEFLDRAGQEENCSARTQEELYKAAFTGKIAFGPLSGEKRPDLQEAKRNAREALEEGRIAVFIGGRQYERPEEPVALAPDTEITFVKLVLLAGRIW